jgi:anaerobic magnesium-protoporphyrin IX monomethyl ester cyclase
MKVCLIYPEPFPLYTSIDTKGLPEGLGLLYLATVIKPHHDVTIIGSAFNPLSCDEIIAKIGQMQPDIIGISTVFSTLMRSARVIARRVKELFPDKVVVFGGNHAHFIAADLIREPYVDVVVLGEAEDSFRELVEHLERGRDLADVRGILYKRDGVPCRTPARPPIQDLDTLPFPERQLFFQKIPENFVIPMLGSRGCPFHCIYCSTTAFWGRRWRARSPESIVAELVDIAERFEVEPDTPLMFGFVDDNLAVDKARLLRFCELLRDSGRTFEWGGSARIEMLDQEMIDALAQSFCTQIFFGVESGSDRVLQRLGRHYTRGEVNDTVGRCIEAGILPTLSFIVGFPFEEPEDVEQTLSLLREVPSYKVQIHMLTPFIGTDIFEKSDELGVSLSSRDTESMSLESTPIISSRHLSSPQIHAYFQRGTGYAAKRYREARFLEERCKKAREASRARAAAAVR